MAAVTPSVSEEIVAPEMLNTVTTTITAHTSSGNKQSATVSPAAIIVPFLFAILFFVGATFWYIRQRKRRMQAKMPMDVDRSRREQPPFTPNTKVRNWIMEHVKSPVKALQYSNIREASTYGGSKVDWKASSGAPPTRQVFSKSGNDLKMGAMSGKKLQKHKPDPLDLTFLKSVPSNKKKEPKVSEKRESSSGSATGVQIPPTPHNLNQLRQAKKYKAAESTLGDMPASNLDAESDNRESVQPLTAATSSFFCQGQPSRMTAYTEKSFGCEDAMNFTAKRQSIPAVPALPPAYETQQRPFKKSKRPPIIPSVAAMSSFHGEEAFTDLENQLEIPKTPRIPSYYARSHGVSMISGPGAPPNSIVSDELADDW